jgi:hypothetical protein
MFTLRQLTGYEGLVAAVIATAVTDALQFRNAKQRVDAWRYLASPDFDRHLEIAGL